MKTAVLLCSRPEWHFTPLREMPICLFASILASSQIFFLRRNSSIATTHFLHTVSSSAGVHGYSLNTNSLIKPSFPASRLPLPLVPVQFQLTNSTGVKITFKNDELTAPKLRKTLQEQSTVDFSDSKVKRLRQKLGWVQTGTKYW